MQNSRIFRTLNQLCRTFLVFSFIISLVQNYFSNRGELNFLGLRFTQFYNHSEVRIIPLVIIAFYLVPFAKNILRLRGNFYFSEFLISLLAAIDAFTHINGYYSTSFNIIFYERIWFDKIMHFNEGLILLTAFFPLAMRFTVKSKRIFPNTKSWAYFLVIAFTSIFFILWEITELFIDKASGTRLITSYYDTNEDLMFAYLGFLTSFILIEITLFLDEIYDIRNQIRNIFSLKAFKI